MTDIQALIEEAKIRYPIECKLSNKNLGWDCEFTVKGVNFRKSSFDSKNLTIDDDSCSGMGSYTVYKNGKWAKIVEYPEGYIQQSIEPLYEVY